MKTSIIVAALLVATSTPVMADPNTDAIEFARDNYASFELMRDRSASCKSSVKVRGVAGVSATSCQDLMGSVGSMVPLLNKAALLAKKASAFSTKTGKSGSQADLRMINKMANMMMDATNNMNYITQVISQ